MTDAPHYDGDIEAVIESHRDWLNGEGGERANLQDADLRDANLRDANLRYANLQSADLQDAYLQSANLWDADLRRADLQSADLQGANLQGANLQDAKLGDAELPAYERLPESGAFEAYKGCVGHVVKIRVPADADRVSSLKGPKCRAEYVETVAVLDADGEPCDADEAHGWYDEETVYREGEETRPDDWDDDIRQACTHGIHIYPTKREAIEVVRE